MTKLMQKQCIPCSGGVPPLPGPEKLKLMDQIGTEWQLTHEKTRLLRKFSFKDYKQALDFVTRVSEMAEEQWHHPEIHFGFGHCSIEVWTHKINNLVESDFIFAAKVNEIFANFA